MRENQKANQFKEMLLFGQHPQSTQDRENTLPPASHKIFLTYDHPEELVSQMNLYDEEA